LCILAELLPGNFNEIGYFEMKIKSNSYIVPGVIGNSYLLVDADGLTLIDTGIPGSAKKS
jgi:glyoxylase-like metal-dependent hydrolase (beta-lactamase superfamily II)